MPGQSNPKQRIVLVGHCGVDAPMLESAIEEMIPSADVVNAQDERALQEVCRDGADLLLVNRELTSAYAEPEGVDEMKRLRKKFPRLKMMLVSDYEDAQQEAEEEAGALPGFGKADIGSPVAEERL